MWLCFGTIRSWMTSVTTMIKSNTTRKEKLGYRWVARWLADVHQLQTDKANEMHHSNH